MIVPPIYLAIMWYVGKESGLVCLVTFKGFWFRKKDSSPGEKFLTFCDTEAFIIDEWFGLDILIFISIAGTKARWAVVCGSNHTTAHYIKSVFCFRVATSNDLTSLATRRVSV
jgi:hypothetical protein